ncbi:MAG: hypothetical protein ACRDYD_03710 [Acidimicrobiales bacterium]
MLDHVLLEAIAALHRSFDGALLERQAAEERLEVDVLLGDVTWETSYSLPGEGEPPRLRADLVLEWSTWSQSAYRSWSAGDPPEDPPEMDIELVLRIQRLADAPPAREILQVLPESGPALGAVLLERCGPTLEQALSMGDEPSEWALEVAYEGVWTLEEAILQRTVPPDEELGPVGPWVASNLVRLADLVLPFLPRQERDGG